MLRASEASLRAALSPAVSGAKLTALLRLRQELLEKRVWAQSEEGGPAGAGEAAQARDAALLAVRQALVAAAGADSGIEQRMMPGESQCHSLWTVSDDGRTQGYRFVVLDTSAQDQPRKWAPSSSSTQR